MPLADLAIPDEDMGSLRPLPRCNTMSINPSKCEYHVGHLSESTKPEFRLSPSPSIFVIGMRGAGKTTSGRWIASYLSLQFVDLDAEIEHRNGDSVSDIVRKYGWAVFRARELEVLEDAMRSRPTGHVFSCGGGIVETAKARELLKGWGGTVLLVHRNTDAMVDYLLIDKTRPVYTERIREVYERRKPWLEECSNALYLSTHSSVTLDQVPSDLARLLDIITSRKLTNGTSRPEKIDSLTTFRITELTLDAEAGQSDLVDASQGCDAIELRIDTPDNVTLDNLAIHIAQVRRISDRPIVFAIGEVWGKPEDTRYQKVLGLYLLAMKMCVEYVAVRRGLPGEVMEGIMSVRRHSRVIMDNTVQADDAAKARRNVWRVIYRDV